nr:CRISPR-associated endonuclease Cas2 [Microcystis sp. LSC13-02]
MHNTLKSYTQYAKLRGRLSKLIKPDTDSIRFYFLCACCRGKVERIGGELPRDNTIFFV